MRRYWGQPPFNSKSFSSFKVPSAGIEPTSIP